MFIHFFACTDEIRTTKKNIKTRTKEFFFILKTNQMKMYERDEKIHDKNREEGFGEGEVVYTRPI